MFYCAIIVQTLSPQSTIISLPPPQKSATFLKNPLERPELEPSMNHPLVQSQPIIPVDSSWEKHLPFSWKKEKGVTTETKNNPQAAEKASVVAAQTQNTDTGRKKLPDEIKAIFDNNSKNFAAYAKKDLQEINKVMDAWDRALLLSEEPIATPEQQKPKRVFFSPEPSLVPQKTDMQEKGTAFPSRVMDEGVASPLPRTEFRVVTTPVIRIKPTPSGGSPIPIKPQNATRSISNEFTPKKAVLPLFTPAIPIKPKQSITGAATPSPLPLLIPKKNLVPFPEQSVLRAPLSQTAPELQTNTAPVNNPLIPPPNMSETLVEKIIEGQMRGVFNNAPPLLQKELEKTTVQEITATSNEAGGRGNIENEVWKKRLREYLARLHEQAVSVFPDVSAANPTEGELVLDYVKRVYPILLKAQVMKQ